MTTRVRDQLADPAPAAQGRGVRGFLLAVALWIAAYTGLSLLTAALPQDAFGSLGWGRAALLLLPLTSVLALVVTSLWVVREGLGCPWRAKGLRLGAIAGAAVCNLIHLARPAAGLSPWTIAQFGVGGVALLVASLCLGRLIGAMIEHPSWLFPIGLVLIAVDVWSVFAGPTQAIAESAMENPLEARAAQRLMLWYPNMTPVAPEGLAVQPSLGIADFIVAALLLEAARRFGLRLRATLAAFIAALLLALVVAALSRAGVPALPFLVVAFFAINWSRLRVNGREVLISAVFLAVLLPVLLFVVNPLVSALGLGAGR